MKPTETVVIRYGNTNTFYIPAKNGGLLVDTDYAGTLPAFYKAIKAAGIEVKDITYLLATHYHPDHIGLTGELQDMGAKLIVADVQVNSVHFADKLYYRDNTQFFPVNLNKAEVVSCEGSRKALKKIGISGEIIPTPSHSKDSVTLLLDNGECFVGDLEPREYLSAYRGDESPELKKDWAEIMKHKPKKVYYGHANSKTV